MVFLSLPKLGTYKLIFYVYRIRYAWFKVVYYTLSLRPILTSPIHWSKATNSSENATHAIDFGPGGFSGIGPLTAKNFDGRGVRECRAFHFATSR